MTRRYVIGTTDVTDAVRANVAKFGRLDDAAPEVQERLRAIFGPAITAVRQGSGVFARDRPAPAGAPAEAA